MRDVADKRAYFKVDVGYFTNPKVAAILNDSPTAVILHLESIAYAAQHLTDGVVPAALVQRLVGATDADASLLLESGMWIDAGKGRVELRDYLEHQRSASEAKKLSEAGRKAATSRWQSDPDANRITDGNANAVRNPMPREKERETENTVASAPARRDVEALCALLADLVEANGSKRPTVTKRWRDSARLLIDNDGRATDEIARVIRWSQASDFWRANVLSMPKLRDKYDTLRMQSERAIPAASTPGDQWARAKRIGGDA